MDMYMELEAMERSKEVRVQATRLAMQVWSR